MIPLETHKPLALVVDDVPAALRLLTTSLRADFRVRAACSGDDAWNQITSRKDVPDALVFDVHTHGCGGMEFLRRLRSDPKFDDMVVIVLAANDSTRDHLDALESGADDFVSRTVIGPILRERILRACRRATDRRLVRLASHIFENAQEALLVTDSRNRIVAANPAFSKQTGYSLEEIVGSNPRLLASGRTSEEEYRVMWSALTERGRWSGEMWDRRKDGTLYPRAVNISLVRRRDGSVDYHVAGFADVSALHETRQQIKYAAQHDTLTGLPNKEFLQLRLGEIVHASKKAGEYVVIMFVNLDRFKLVIDNLGHAIGDTMLVDVARCLKACVREDDLVARFSGDEFVVVIHGNEGAAAASAVTSDIQRALKRPFRVGAKNLRVAASIGVAIFPDDGQDPNSLLRAAATALHVAKAENSGSVSYFKPHMLVKFHHDLELESQLQEAIERGQLMLHFQPQIALASATVCGAEALLRWHHPELGQVAPSVFVPLAEKTSQILSLGKWVLREACRLGQSWLRGGLSLPSLAINVSWRQLQTEDFFESIRHILEETSFPAERLELEVTESTLASATNVIAQRLRELRDVGVKISLDDFGTGYSSLSQLRELPLDQLKIDAAFVRDISNVSPRGGAIAAATIAMAHNLGFEVLAEGVETTHQLAFLSRLNCDCVQGYLFSRPLAADDFKEYVTKLPQAELRSLIAGAIY